MNSPINNIPDGSTPEQKQQGRKRFYFAFFTIVSLNALFLVFALFIQGCKRQPEAEQQVTVDMHSTTPSPDTNSIPVTEVASSTNAPVQTPDAVQPVVEATPLPVVTPPPAASPTEHTIAKGDLLGDIAKKYGITLKVLKAANPTVDEKRLQIGKKLVIPPPTTAADLHNVTLGAPSGVAEAGEQVHVVKSGENLTVIANRYGSTVRAIQSLNGMKDTRIKVGEKLKIPVKVSAPAAAVEPSSTSPSAVPVSVSR